MTNEQEVLEIAEERGAVISVEEIYDGTADNPPIGAIITYSFEEAQLIDFAQAIRDQEAEKRAQLEAQIAMLVAEHNRFMNVLRPFATIVNKSSGAIPTKKLSFDDWHTLAKLFNEFDGRQHVAKPTDDAFVARIKAEALEEAHNSISSRIKNGELKGNGLDEMAERNGLILAANIVAGLRKGKE